MFGLKISEGCVSTIIAQAGNLASAKAAEIRKAVKSSSVIQSDGTMARIKVHNYWNWVFLSAPSAYHQIVPRRNAEVIRDLMEQMIADVLVSNCFSAQIKAPTRNFQICLQYQLRDLKRVFERLPKSA